jgi:hypothetical protein
LSWYTPTIYGYKKEERRCLLAIRVLAHTPPVVNIRCKVFRHLTEPAAGSWGFPSLVWRKNFADIETAET